MERIVASPSRYVQGKRMLQDGIKYIKALGEIPLLITDEEVWAIAGKELLVL